MCREMHVEIVLLSLEHLLQASKEQNIVYARFVLCLTFKQMHSIWNSSLSTSLILWRLVPDYFLYLRSNEFL